MKKMLFGCLMAAFGILLMASCQGAAQKKTGACRIHGTIPQQFNGKRIFLVPMFGPQTTEFVDSIEVKDGQFEFTTDTVMMAKLLVDYHYRMGIQELLVVTEPGDVEVTIDSVSQAHGTPQNDSLQQWKVITEKHNSELAHYSRSGQKEKADSVHKAYRQQTRSLGQRMEGTVLGDFLTSLYPLTYKRQMPDGRIATFNADTNEEIPE